MLGLVVFIQAASFVAVYIGARNTVVDDARERLEVGGRVFGRLLGNHVNQLDAAVEVLASDFGFKKAVATRDAGTIRSALLNQASRVNADLVMLVDTDGQVIATAEDTPRTQAKFPFETLFNTARRTGNASGTAFYEGQAYELVMVLVYAPLPIGWVCMGFAMDHDLAVDLKGLTGLEVSFVGRPAGEDSLHLVSTLPQAQQDKLAAEPGLVGTDGDAQLRSVTLAGEDFFTLPVPLVNDAQSSVTAILQNSLRVALKPYAVLKGQMLGIAASALMVALMLAFFMGRSLSRPLHVLARAAKRVEAGDYSEAVQVDATDEVSELASAFNSMQTGLADREERIAFQAFHDVLTGLPNRSSMQLQLETAIVRAQRRGSPGAALMLDINRFKDINDSLGHHTGDQVLMETAQRLRRLMRPGDAVARHGADQFFMLLDGTDAAAAEGFAGRIAAAMRAPVTIGDMQVTPEVSIGIVLYPVHGADTETLIRRADIAMSDAKQARVPWHMYESGRDERYLKDLELVSDLRRAIERNELSVHYQPKASVHDMQITGLEALLRWQHPRIGAIPPDEFIALAEQSGNIHLLTEWVLRQVINQCREWQRSGWAPVVSVNLSAMDLLNPELPAALGEWLRASGVPARQLVLEITESTVMSDPTHATQVLHRLKAAGVRLSIDDFGTGYSSLAQLKRLPVDELKIDKSFIMQLREHSEDAVIVRSTIELAHNMGLEVTAEGVETDEGLRFLRAHKCDLAQGYFISHPMPLDKLEIWMNDYRKARSA